MKSKNHHYEHKTSSSNDSYPFMKQDIKDNNVKQMLMNAIYMLNRTSQMQDQVIHGITFGIIKNNIEINMLTGCTKFLCY